MTDKFDIKSRLDFRLNACYIYIGIFGIIIDPDFFYILKFNLT